MTAPMLVWTESDHALYVRGPSRIRALPLDGVLYGYALRRPSGRWEVRVRVGQPSRRVVASKRAARDLLRQIGAAS